MISKAYPPPKKKKKKNVGQLKEISKMLIIPQNWAVLFNLKREKKNCFRLTWRNMKKKTEVARLANQKASLTLWRLRKWNRSCVVIWSVQSELGLTAEGMERDCQLKTILRRQGLKNWATCAIQPVQTYMHATSLKEGNMNAVRRRR